MIVLPDNDENMGKGGSGGHASNQPPVAVEGPAIYIFSPMTNADRVRSKTDEELADWVWGIETAGRAYGPRGKKAWLGWLKQEASE